MGTQRQSVVNIYIYILCNSNILLINEGVYNIHTLSLLFKGCQVEVMEEVEWGVWYQNKSIFSTVHVTRFRSRVWHKENRQEGRKQCISPLKPFFHKDRRCTESCGAPGHPLLKGNWTSAAQLHTEAAYPVCSAESQKMLQLFSSVARTALSENLEGGGFTTQP